MTNFSWKRITTSRHKNCRDYVVIKTMLYVGDKVRVKANNKHCGKEGEIVSKTERFSIYGKPIIKYYVRTVVGTLYFKEKHLELVLAKDNDSLLEWIGRGVSMKVGDKVWDSVLGNEGVIIEAPHYRIKESASSRCDNVMVLYCKVECTNYTVLCELEDLELYETPQLCESQLVQISMRAEMYWGMTGTIIELIPYGVLVKLDGYTRPIEFKLGDIEPLSDGSLLVGWLDSLLPVKEY